MTTEPKRNDVKAAPKTQSIKNDTRHSGGGTSSMIAVWDVWTRLFHWSLAGAVVFLLISGSTGFLFFDWHRLIGEFVLMLIVFRILWGLVGSSNVRFTNLLKDPRLAVAHLRSLIKRDVSDVRGHNSAGGWAVAIMLILILTQAVTGLFIADEDELIEGAFYGVFNSNSSDFLYRIHHLNSELIIAIVSIHVVMISLYWLYAGKNLVLPMITGRMRWSESNQPQKLFIQRWWVGLVCLIVVVSICAAVLQWNRHLF